MPDTAQSTLDFIESVEGLSLKPYRDEGGRWTIGYGFTYDADNKPVSENTAPITLAQADSMLPVKVSLYADAVKKYVKGKLNQNQYDACVSLCFNIGMLNFSESTVCKQINAGNYAAAAAAFAPWKLVNGKVSRGLVNRRAKESALFLS